MRLPLGTSIRSGASRATACCCCGVNAACKCASQGALRNSSSDRQPWQTRGKTACSPAASKAGSSNSGIHWARQRTRLTIPGRPRVVPGKDLVERLARPRRRGSRRLHRPRATLPDSLPRAGLPNRRGGGRSRGRLAASNSTSVRKASRSAGSQSRSTAEACRTRASDPPRSTSTARNSGALRTALDSTTRTPRPPTIRPKRLPGPLRRTSRSGNAVNSPRRTASPGVLLPLSGRSRG